MLINTKILKLILCITLALICLYTGISCAAALMKSLSQPYLVSGTVRYDFVGYYIMSAAYGAAALISAIALFFSLKPSKPKTEN